MADFIITSLQPWGIGIGSTIKNTAIEISKQHRVLYVNTPSGIGQWLKQGVARFLKRRKPAITKQINKNLRVMYCTLPVLPVGSIPFRRLFNAINYLNNLAIAYSIRREVHRYGYHDCIHLIDTDLFRSRYLKKLLYPTLSIYYRRDYIIGVDYWKRHGSYCEEALVRQSDIVLTNSGFFTKQLRPLNPHTYTINTGVNLELYDANRQWQCPACLQDLPHPIVGYTGVLTASRLNTALLYDMARRLPGYSFVFVGPEDAHFQSHPLHTLHNVFFTGHREVKELPAYISYFDICINPQQVNPITEGNYPLKIDEYLAMGKPVVATSTHTMRDVFAAHTHLANNTDEWIAALQCAAAETNEGSLRRRRIAFAHSHSWSHSVASIYQAIEKIVPSLLHS